MVRPSQEGRVRPLSDAESLEAGDGTTIGSDGVDIDAGGSDGGGTIVAPAAEELVVVPDGGSSVSLDFDQANWWDITLTQDCTLAIANPPASGTVGRLHVILRQGGAGGWAVTWPAEVEWADTDGTSGGSAPALYSAVDSRSEIELITEDGGTSYGGTSRVIPGAGGSGNLPWFNVMDVAYGALNDGSTDDTAEINTAIAAMNSAGGGVLYFPAGTGYVVTGPLTALTASGTIMGDGMGSYSETDVAAFGTSSVIFFDSDGDDLFTSDGGTITLRDISLVNAAGSVTGGSAFAQTGTDLRQHTVIERTLFLGFYDQIDIGINGLVTIIGNSILESVHWGCRIRNTVNPDGGGLSFMGNALVNDLGTPAAGLRIESSGGNKVIGNSFNLDGGVHGIDLTASAESSILLIEGNQIENYTGDAIHLDGNGHLYGLITIDNNEFGQYNNGTGHGIFADEIHGLAIGQNTYTANMGTPTAISLNNGSQAVVAPQTLYGTWAAQLATSSFTGLLDTTGGVAAGVAITGTPSSGQVPVATGAAAAVWDDITVDASDVAITDSGGYYSSSDVEGALAEIGAGGIGGGGGGHYEVIVSGTAPPVAVTNIAEDDWLYGFVAD